MTTARDKDVVLASRLSARGIPATLTDVQTLRRAERTLQRWAEGECGDSNAYASVSIERDEHTNKPFRCVYSYTSTKVIRIPIPDREAGALRRIDRVCKRLDIHWYHQTDPRGCMLYVAREPLTAATYTNGVACG